ncbi:MAG: nucleotidyl transferase AbiEii/AbiGii toxin family protein [Chloroflexi bacterium]|nr:nucleotidyl transferase AbiEii/AbiGii toxin family protein [Chloroflexota bacterium]
MKPYLADLVRAAPTPAHGRNVAREYLQARILGAMQRAGAMIPLAFHGGTALRFLYAIPRYVDTNPPSGAVLATTVIRRHVILQLQHHDRAAMLAGKLHALLQRPYTKGRDLYDLLWYLSDPDWPAPNLTLLNHALRQTGWAGAEITVETWRSVLAGQLQRLQWDRVVDDVRPLLDVDADPALLTRENVLQVVMHSRLRV